MKRYGVILPVFILLLASSLLSCERNSPRPVIFDTDWWTDVDDACAMRTLLWAEKEGLVSVKGVCLSAVNGTSVASLSSFLDNEGRHGLPLGADKQATDFTGNPTYHTTIIGSHPHHEVSSLDEIPDCTDFYRKLLADSRGKVDIIAVGYPNALARLLHSVPDKISPLTGRELVQKKVRHLWMMAGKYPEGRENNFCRARRSLDAGVAICTEWPTDITFLGYEVGVQVKVGGGLPEDDLLHIILAAHGSAEGRYAWDPLLTRIACLGSPEGCGFETVGGTVVLDGESGQDHFVPDPNGHHRYVRMIHDSQQYSIPFRKILGEL